MRRKLLKIYGIISLLLAADLIAYSFYKISLRAITVM